MYKIDRRGGGGSKNRSIGQTPFLYFLSALYKKKLSLKVDCPVPI